MGNTVYSNQRLLLLDHHIATCIQTLLIDFVACQHNTIQTPNSSKLQTQLDRVLEHPHCLLWHALKKILYIYPCYQMDTSSYLFYTSRQSDKQKQSIHSNCPSHTYCRFSLPNYRISIALFFFQHALTRAVSISLYILAFQHPSHIPQSNYAHTHSFCRSVQ